MWTKFGVMDESSTDVRDQPAGRYHGGPYDERQRGEPFDAARNDAVASLAVNERSNRHRQHHPYRDQGQLRVVHRDVAGGRRVGREENAAGHQVEEKSAPEDLEE